MLKSSTALTVTRVCLGTATVLNALETHVILTGLADGRFAMPVFAGVPTLGHAAANVHVTLAVAAGVAITSGVRVALAATLATVLTCVAFLLDQQTYSNHQWLCLLLVAFLIAARADSPRLGGRTASAAPPRWPQHLMMVQLTVCYAFAALSKVNPAFLSGEPLNRWVRWDLPAWATLVMAVATVVTELFLAAGLWFRPTRRLAAVLGVALHVSIVVMIPDETVALITFSVMCLGIYPLFFVAPEAPRGSTATLPSSVLRSP